MSVTLSEDNLLWLKGQAARTAKGSVSDVLDRIVAEARVQGRTDPDAIRSVAGTIDLPAEDPDLSEADAYIRSLFAASARQPMIVRERGAAYRVKKKGRRG